VITTVVFDADDTLIDLQPALRGALAAVLEEMRRLTPAAAAVSVADLEADAAAVFDERAAAPVVEIRRAALARSLARVGLTRELDRVAKLFFARRFALTRPFADALPALAELRQTYTVGYATNGNSRTERCGLAGEFAFELYAHVDGVPKKPAPGFYAAVLAAAGGAPASVVYVGDSIEHDVVGAQAAGLRAVWLNRAGAPCPASAVPDGEISSLADLPAAIEKLLST
jgi:FMN hydrolase / 5-amino-6-(5-phospho-D-ribitylamino)uracil phosphatase